MTTESGTARAQRWALAVLLAVIAFLVASGYQAHRPVASAASVTASQASYEATAPQRAPGPLLTPSVHRVLGPAETLPYAAIASHTIVESPAWQQNQLALDEPPQAAEQLPGFGVRAPPSR